MLSLNAQAQVTVTSRQPVRHAVAAARTSAVTVGFSQAVSAATAPNVRVYGSQLRGRWPGSVTGGGTATLTFTPNQAFLPGEVLSVSLPSTLTSTGGTALTRHVYQFTAATGGGGRGFFGDTSVVGNTGNRDQVLGDLDNDGDLDLVTTGALYGCRIFLNNGAGRYVFHTGVVAAETPSGVALADVNGDGYLDMLVGDADNAVVAVCINDGTANFIGSVTGAQNAPVGSRPVSVAAGDVDGDGDLDFVTANNAGNSATVRYNNGTLPLLYTTSTTVNVGSGPTSVALADVDNDGDLDLLTANAGTANSPIGTVSVSRNSGTGAFGAAISFGVGLQPSELVLADVDGDGDLDLLTADAGAASMSLRINNGSGTFSSLTTLALPAGSTPSGLRTGDVDADGDLDVLVAQGVGGRIFTFLNSAGTFARQARPLRLSRTPANPLTSVGVTLGDVDGDLDLDLITSDEQGHVLLSLNVGALAPLPAPVISSLSPDSGPVGSSVTIAGTALTDVAAVLFNGTTAPGFVLNGMGTALEAVVPAGATSGLVTVVTEDAGTATSPAAFTIVVPVPVLLTGIVPARNAASAPRSSNITASFTAPITAATAGNLRVFGSQRRGNRPGVLSGSGTAALTLDPTQDFAPGEVVSVSLPGSLRAPDGNRVSKQVVQFTAAVGGSGRHDFVTSSTLTMAGSSNFRVGDFDNDGDVDVAAPGGAQGVLLRLNNGAGAFTALAPLTNARNADLLAVGDVDADGDLDIFSTTAGGTCTVWLNNGSGAFTSSNPVDITGNGSVNVVSLADVDADGDLDLLAVAGGSTVVTLFNNGNGAFASPQYSYLDVAAYDLAVGDVDGDGDLDLVTPGRSASQGYDRVCIALNNGAGTFVSAPALTQNSGASQRVALGDVDGDGDLDLAIRNANSYPEQVLIRLNDGTGLYSAVRATLPLGGLGLALADTDADGDLDVVTHAGIALNDGTGLFPQVVTTTDAGPNATASLVALADLDGDLDLDLLVGDQPGTLRVKLNRPGPPPTLISLSPGSGPVGSSVIVTGTNFGGFTKATGLTFNGVAATDFALLSATKLVATVPVGATTGPVQVTTPAGTAASPTAFAVTQPLELTALNPARNARSVAVQTTVAATFAQPVSAATAGELRVFGAQRGGRRTGTVAGGGTQTLTFTPAQPLAAGEIVSVSIPDRLTGTDGSRARRQVYQFTAAASGTGTGLFLPATNGRPFAGFFYGYVNPYTGFATGDMDHDGTIDMVTSEGVVYFNNGAGAFTDSTEHWMPSPLAQRVALADLDADGTLDVIGTNGSVLLNKTGLGDNFERQPPITGLSEHTLDLATGDLDADGDLDLVTVDDARDSVQVRFNDGKGRFAAPFNVAVGQRPVGITLGDVDNDGDLDFVVANAGKGPGTGTLSIGLNNGIGLFTAIRSLAAGTGVSAVALGDLDGDSDLDLVISNGLVRLNDGTGTFSGSQTAAATGHSLALADVDADGDLDLVVAKGANAAVCRNSGTGQFGSAEALAFGSAVTARYPVLADLDADGDLDLLVADSTNHAVHRYLNQRIAPPAAISFAPASGLPGTEVLLTGTDLIGTTEVTFNGVAAPDFTVLTASRLAVRVPAGATTGPLRLTNPKGSATSATAFTVFEPVAISSVSPAPQAVAPRTAPVVVGFGRAIPTNSAATLAVFSQRRGGRLAGTRTGAGSTTLTFTPARPYEPGEQLSVSIPAHTDANQRRVEKRVYQFVAATGGTGQGHLGDPVTLYYGGGYQSTLGDVDGDGDPDLVNCATYEVELVRNNGAGVFGTSTPAMTYPTGSGPLAVALGDVDGDGDLDLAVSTYDSLKTSSVSIRLNDGTGTFSGSVNVPVGSARSECYANKLVLGDFDGDGDLDVLTGNISGRAWTTSVALNDGNGKFTTLPEEVIFSDKYNIGGGTTVNLLVGDLDGDGDLDALATTYYAAKLRLNDGNGHFTSSSFQLPIPSYMTGMTLSDADSDGDLDILFLNNGAYFYQDRVNVGLNDGKGRFTLKTGVMLTSNFLLNAMDNMVAGDVDADGDQDLVICNFRFGNSQVLLNNGQGNYSLFPEPYLSSNYASIFGPYLPLLSDLDGDGDVDLLNGGHIQFNGPAPRLAINSFTPTSGPEGATVVLTGTGFLGTSAVRFNGTDAPGFVVESPTQISVKVPAGASTGLLSVTTPFATATSAAVFTVRPVAGLSGLSPGRNAVAAARNAPIRLTTTAAVSAATAGNLRVFGNLLRGQRPGTVTGGGTATLSFNPAQDFAPGEQVSVSLPATMQTTTGGIVQRQVYQFTAATGGAGRGFFRAGTDLTANLFTYALATGDLDNDGDLDVLTSSRIANDFGVAVLLNDGQARFSPGTRLSSGARTAVWHLKLGDVDGDGDLDLVISAGTLDPRVCLNNGNATFTPPQVLANFYSDWADLGDVDADGDLDLVTVGNAALNVALNDGRGRFTPLPALTSLSGTMVTLGDVDGDGDLDALTTGGSGGVVLFLNNGSGTYAYSSKLPAQQAAQSVALGDVDGDGDLDVAMGYNDSAGDGWLATLVNDGNGQFGGPGGLVAAGRLLEQVLLADVDHDADLDLLALNTNSDNASIRLNNGGGIFSGSQSAGLHRAPSRMALGDFDGDGDLDLAAVQGSNSVPFVDIRLNEALALAAAPTSYARGVQVYPNPARGQFVVVVPTELRPPAARTPLRLYNAVGQLVLEQPLRLSANGELTVHAARLPAGLYTLHLVLKYGPATYKIVLD